MIQKIILILTLALFAFFVCCQENSNELGQIMSLKEQQQIINNSKNYSASIMIADSLYKAYNNSHFYLKQEAKPDYSSGLAFVLNLYIDARKKTLNTKYCDSIIAKIEIELEVETLEHIQQQYQLIKIKAEESYSNGNLDRAIELYKRAINLKPSDEQAKKRLTELMNE